MANIEHFEGTYTELVARIRSAKRVAVIDLFATWCGPCQRLGQVLPSIAQKYPALMFLKVDGDRNREIAARMGISAYPTVKFVRCNGDDLITVGEVVGLNVPEINRQCEECSRISARPPEAPGPHFDDFVGLFDELVQRMGTFEVPYAVIEAYKELPESLDRVLASISRDFPQLHFLRIDLSRNDEIDSILQLKQVPTVLFYRYANESIYKCDEVAGMDTVSLREKCSEIMKSCNKD